MPILTRKDDHHIPKEAPTFYRATWEFTLRFPSHYPEVRAQLEIFTKVMEANFALQNSFLSIEKLEKQK